MTYKDLLEEIRNRDNIEVSSNIKLIELIRNRLETSYLRLMSSTELKTQTYLSIH